jgi:hypothetical protein
VPSRADCNVMAKDLFEKLSTGSRRQARVVALAALSL